MNEMNRKKRLTYSIILMVSLLCSITVGYFFSTKNVKADENLIEQISQLNQEEMLLEESVSSEIDMTIAQLDSERKIVTTREELVSALIDTSVVDIYIDAPLIEMTGAVTVSSNKRIDLNGNTLSFVGNTAKLFLNGFENFTDVTIFSSTEEQGKIVASGHTSGNYRGFITDGRADNVNAPNIANNGQNKDLTVTFQNIDVNSANEFVYLFLAKEVVFKGNIDIYTAGKGVVATNITMYGNPDDRNDPENANVYSKTGSSTGNPSEYAYYFGPLNFALAPNYGSNSATWDRRGADEIKFLVQKNANVYAENNGTLGAGAPYQNVVANYRIFENNGTFRGVAKNNGSALRTITSNGTNAQSPHAKINLNKGAVTEISTLGNSAYYGAIFSYKMDLVVDEPEIFDVRYFGTRQFFFAWSSGTNSSVTVNNMDHAVWETNQSGIGNPNTIWQDVDSFTITNLFTTNRGTIASTNPDMQQNFNFNNYSRWSNDILLPVIIPENDVSISGDIYEITNNRVGLSGNTAYSMPDGSITEKIAANATLNLTLGTGAAARNYTTVADENGNWNFDDVDFKQFAGGTTGTIKLVDVDQRTNEIKIIISDNLPPVAESKVLRTLLNSISGIPDNPREALQSFSDETTPNQDLEIVWITTDEEKQEVVKSVGLKQLKISISDAAGNETIVEVPLLVEDEESVTTADGSVRGIDFTMNRSQWEESTNEEKRELVITMGEARGYEIINNTITEVTNDPSKFIMNFSEVGSNTATPYPIELNVGTARKNIYVTFENEISTITTNFVDEESNALNEPIIISGNIGSTVDLTKEQNIIDVINDIISRNYVLDSQPENESGVLITQEGSNVYYRFSGVISIVSAPNALDFGSLTYNATTKRVEDPSIDQPLIVTDTRANTADGWTLTASLSTPMRNSEGQELINALRYVYGGQETILDTNAQTVYLNNDGSAGRFEVSNSWGNQTGTDGVKLQIGSSDIVHTGSYVGVITWKVMAGQP